MCWKLAVSPPLEDDHLLTIVIMRRFVVKSTCMLFTFLGLFSFTFRHDCSDLRHPTNPHTRLLFMLLAFSIGGFRIMSANHPWPMSSSFTGHNPCSLTIFSHTASFPRIKSPKGTDFPEYSGTSSPNLCKQVPNAWLRAFGSMLGNELGIGGVKRGCPR